MSPIESFNNALKQLSRAKKYLRLPEGIWDILENPEREIIVHFPVKMDDRHIEVFTGYRVQYNNAFGPYKGGTRFHPSVNMDEMRALAFWMMIKTTIAGIPMGGSKGGVEVDPKVLSGTELERVTRGFIKAITPSIGPYVDVPGPDMGTPPLVMHWMADEFKKQTRETTYTKYTDNELLSTFTGKPVQKGGSAGREEATARGGIYVLQALLKTISSPITHHQSRTIAVQGFGNLGYHFARIAHEEGFKVVAISDSKNAVYVPNGIDPVKTLHCKEKNGTLAKCFCNEERCDVRNGKLISNQQLLELSVDILIPSAIENVLTKENAHKVKAKIILEMANGPTTPEADDVFQKKKILVVPDVLANSGGVIVSCFEWQQNLKGAKWTLDDVRKKLHATIVPAFEQVWQVAKKKKIDLRTAAYIVAVERLAKKLRG